jgi:hypothetical protein
MDQKRRDFFRNLGSKSVGLAAGAVAPTMLYIDSLKAEIKSASQKLNQKLAKSSDELISQMQMLSSRLDRAAIIMTYQQAQIFLIFFLLLVSFAIDAGMTATWILV